MENKCCFCGEGYGEFGNNAQPLNEGRCCDECNIDLVLTIRLKQLRSKK